jgi:hypothetical protein
VGGFLPWPLLQWEVEAVGRIGSGCAGTYEPINEWICSPGGPSAAKPQ